MNTQDLSMKFDRTFLDDLFPFYICLDQNLNVKSIGKSLLKIDIVNEGTLFSSNFRFIRPHSIRYEFESLIEFNQQIIIIKSIKNEKLILRGQFYCRIQEKEIYFLGSPWITNADDLNILNLKIPDFALHDTLTDMIQLLKSKDLLMEDIQSLVNHLKDQEKTLLGSEQKLKVTNTRLSALIQNLNSAILVENENRQIALTNQLFCTLFKISAPPEDLIGVDCSNAAEQSKLFFKEPDIFVLRINEILYKKEIVLNEEVYMLDGKVLERDFIPITFQNEYQGHLWQYRDITSRKLNEKELIEAKENAIQSKKAKERFLTNMSHEIRTPINIISGLTVLLLESELSKDQLEKAEIIKFSSENLLSIVNDILDFEKIQSRKLKLELEPFELKNILKDTVRSLKFIADQKGIKLIEYIDGNLPEVVNGDQLRLKQILINLINNAIKFTEKGTVEVFANIKNINSSLLNLELRIKDSGIGIDEDKLEMVFKRFVQAQSDTTRKYGGTGLGLTIVKKLVELHKGKIKVISKVGIGSEFIIHINYPIVKQKIEIYTHSSEVLIPDFSNLKLLLVEDNPLNQMLIEGVLEKTKISLFKVDNGKNAIEFLEKENVDLILMDLQMPILDGFETTKYIRNIMESKLRCIPIIALTANALASERTKCLEVGMDDMLTKPFAQVDLFHKIKYFTTPVTIVNLDVLRKLYPGDEQLVFSMVQLFLKQMPLELSQLKEYIEKKELNQILGLAHKIKPMFEYMGMYTERQICQEMENMDKKEFSFSIVSEQFKKLNQNTLLAYKELENYIKN